MSAPVEQGDDRNDLTTIPLDHAPYKYSRAAIEKHMRIGVYWMPAFAGMTGGGFDQIER
jgi:hypothetical protein